MPKPSFRVGRSRTGLGLFANRLIKKREYIVSYRGPLITNEEADRLEARGSRYMFEVNSRWTIDGSSRRNRGRYVNHSCRPNAEAVQRKGLKIVYVARRNIKPDEEITVDYGKDYFDSFITKARCRCDKCRERRAKRQAEWRAKKKRAEQRLARLGQLKLNGSKANGAKVNGAKLNGAKMNGAKLNGIALNGSKSNGINTKRAKGKAAKPKRGLPKFAKRTPAPQASAKRAASARTAG